MNVKNGIRKLIRKTGFDIVKYNYESHPIARRLKLLENYNINIVLDVGANIGQYAKKLIANGFTGKIVSFEPLSEAFRILTINAQSYNSWIVKNLALGDKECKTNINVSANSQSSSILSMLPKHEIAELDSKYINKEEIQLTKLDLIFNDIYSKGQNIYLKLDTQGFEKKIIDGAEKSLNYIDTIQIEMSLIPLYEEGLLFNEMYELITGKGYTMVSIEPGFSDKETGQLYQVDGIFHRF
jgi:FkbM family methyltransferase